MHLEIHIEMMNPEMKSLVAYVRQCWEMKRLWDAMPMTNLAADQRWSWENSFQTRPHLHLHPQILEKDEVKVFVTRNASRTSANLNI